jgi:hypothetical protein
MAIFKKGDKVRTGHFERECHIVRTVTKSSGILVEADGGEACECCGYQGRATPPLKPEWFSKVEEEE